VLFLFSGYSSIFHQGMKDNEKEYSGTERQQIFFFPADNVLLTAKVMMKSG